GARMNDPVAVPLKVRPPVGGRFRIFAAACFGAELRVRRQKLPLALFQFLARGDHRHGSSKSCTETPRNSKSRRIVSSIKLFGQDAPAVMPTVIFPAGNQSRVSTSLFRC